MQSQFQTNPAERRYRPETVQKAAALAARLQEERRETLSQAEVDELAAEIGLDPKLMRQALEAVAHTEGTVPVARKRRSPFSLGLVCCASGVSFLILLSLLGAVRAARQSSPALVSTPPVQASILTGGSLLHNGDFEAGVMGGKRKFFPGSSSLPGWTVENGTISLLASGAGAGGHALQLGEVGRIQQIFRTVPGQIYRVTLSLSGEPGAAGRLHRVEVQAGNSAMTPSTFTEPGTGKTGAWETTSFNFRAEDVGTPLTIATAPPEGTGAGAPIIDDVRVEPVLRPY